MINMGFGDCFVIENEGKKILVDCGSKCKSKYRQNLRFVDPDIEEVLITHFHEDHYNFINEACFWNLKKVYLSPLFYSEKDKNVVEVYLFLLFFLMKRRFNSFFNLWKWISTQNRIRFLWAGDHFSKNKFKVLWPKKSTKQSSLSMITESIEGILGEVDKYFDNAKEIREKIENFRKYLKRFIDNLYYLYKLSQPEDSSFQDIEIDHKFKSFFESKTSKDLFTIDEIREIKKIILSMNNKIKNDLIKSMNDCSVVFDGCVNNEKVLFCADASPNIINQIRKGIELSSEKKYKVIKVPHHGTKNYRVDLPDSEYYFIPNDNSRRGWQISGDILQDLSNKPNAFIITGRFVMIPV